jgi:hypothetical protein
VRILSNNQDLYDYLRSLIALLNERGAEALGKIVSFAAGQTFMSTEFLGESRIALRRVLSEENGILNHEEREDLSQVLTQISDALNRHF